MYLFKDIETLTKPTAQTQYLTLKKNIFFKIWHRFIGGASYKSMWFVRLHTLLYYSYGMKLHPFQKHFLEDHNRCTPDGFYHCYAEREVQVHFLKKFFFASSNFPIGL